METQPETLEGYVVDLACLRSYPQDQLSERAREHTKKCILMGHCMESGYGLVDDQGQIRLLEPEATPDIVRAVQASFRDAGIRVRVTRESKEGKMETRQVQEI